MVRLYLAYYRKLLMPGSDGAPLFWPNDPAKHARLLAFCQRKLAGRI